MAAPMNAVPVACLGRVDLVLFDLDGTLVDSAPDLAGAANELRAEQGLPPLPYESLRPHVGSGARGMVGRALGVVPGDDAFPALRDRYLALYEARLLQLTRPFAAIEPVLDALEAVGLRWGIVTNKNTVYAQPVVRGLGLDRRSAVLVCGDTAARAKPHPEPLWHAAEALGVAPARCAYVGDDLRDMQAARAAGMAALAAAWGYLGEAEPITQWPADAVLNVPAELLQWCPLP